MLFADFALSLGQTFHLPPAAGGPAAATARTVQNSIGIALGSLSETLVRWQSCQVTKGEVEFAMKYKLPWTVSKPVEATGNPQCIQLHITSIFPFGSLIYFRPLFKIS